MKTTLSLSSRTLFRNVLPLAAIALALANAPARAAVPAAEKLLPDDTLVMLSVPDMAKLRDIQKASPQAKLWDDPAMKPFKDSFISKLNEELVKPLERELGVQLDNYTSLPQGQLTFAVTQNNWMTAESQVPGFILLLDAKDKSGLLKTNLNDLKRKWLDAGKTLKTEKIRDVEFSVLPLSSKDMPDSLKKFFSEEDEDASEETNKTPQAELVFGQFQSLLIVGNSTKAVEKIAVHLTGGSAPALADLAAFESTRVSMFRDAPIFGWVNAKAFLDLLTKGMEKESNSSNPMMAMFNVSKILSATGIGAIRTFAFNIQSSPDGTSAQLFIGAPESARQGVLKLFPVSGKDSSPPPFVPADVVKFERSRMDGQKAWTTIKSILKDVSPEMSGSLDFIVGTANEAAKQKDPNFDIEKNLFGNLGDDFLSYEKAAQGATEAELNAPPSLFLIGSPHADQFASAMKAVLTLMNPQAGNPKEREFLGRKIYTVPAPSVPMAGTANSGKNLNYSASGGYVALTTDIGMLEEYLRSSEGQQKTLRETAGLTEATAKVGGSSTGWFGYENNAETTRSMLELLRKSATKTDASMLAPGVPAFAPENPLKDWMDFSLLPPFEKISKYFHYSVYAGNANVDGWTFNFFSPVPPGLKK
jgi:hypothetical protein